MGTVIGLSLLAWVVAAIIYFFAVFLRRIEEPTHPIMKAVDTALMIPVIVLSKFVGFLYSKIG